MFSKGAFARIIADSISPTGERITTFHLRYWRPIHAELMTHRLFSRNAGSSRARPAKSIIDQVLIDPWGPNHWGKNQRGMQAHEELSGVMLESAKENWKYAAAEAAHYAARMSMDGLHKQVVNRILEPYTYIDVLVTATDFANWFALRDHPDAQPEIRDLAKLMLKEYLLGEGDEQYAPTLLQPGQWHLPYITEEDWVAADAYLRKHRSTSSEPTYGELLNIVIRISVARCARVSYKAFDGNVAPVYKDLELYDQLIVSHPMHASPAEHQATPDERVWIQRIAVASPEDYANGDDEEDVIDTTESWQQGHLHGNFRGWIQYRKTLPNEYVRG